MLNCDVTDLTGVSPSSLSNQSSCQVVNQVLSYQLNNAEASTDSNSNNMDTN